MAGGIMQLIMQALGHFTQQPFTREGPDLYQQAYARNKEWAHPGPYHTQLTPQEEQAFRQWVQQKGVPFDPNAAIVDYDMRGFWKEQPKLAQAWQRGHHFPDTYKTPYDTTFSAESKYAKPGTPFIWQGNNLIDKRSNAILFQGGNDGTSSRASR